MEPREFDEIFAQDLIDNPPNRDRIALECACMTWNAAVVVAMASGAEWDDPPWMTPEKLTGEQPEETEQPDRYVSVDQFEAWASQKHGPK